MSEIGGVNDIDHRDDVSASSLPVQGDDGHQYPARQHDAEDAEDRLEKGSHSTADPHGMTASDTADASLIPTAFAAYARQMYCAPFVRPPIRAVVSTDPTSTAGDHVAPPSPEHS